MKTDEEISLLHKNDRGYYHILKDLNNEIKDIMDLMAMEEEWSEADTENFKGQLEGLQSAVSLITRAIDGLEKRSLKG